MQRLDPDDPRPQFAQVAEAIRREIADGALRAGDRLPSHAEVAQQCGVSVGTVKRAFGLLQDDGVIVTRQGQPAHVRAQRAEQPATGLDPLEVRAALAALDQRLAAVEQRLTQSPR